MKEFTMTQADLDELLEACKPVPVMMIGGVVPLTVQENANNAWERLGKKMGFKGSTARPCGKGNLVFMAEPI